jgi:hypothetical protein
VNAGSLLLAMAVWVPIAIGTSPTPGTKQFGASVLSKRAIYASPLVVWFR